MTAPTDRGPEAPDPALREELDTARRTWTPVIRPDLDFYERVERARRRRLVTRLLWALAAGLLLLGAAAILALRSLSFAP